MGAGLAVLVALLSGAAWGDDDHFPFGPFRMYSTTSQPDGEIKAVRIEATTSLGESGPVPFSHFGLRRAEIEGQLPRFIENPSLLRHLATAYEHFGEGEQLVEITLLHRITELEDARPVGYADHPLVTWPRP